VNKTQFVTDLSQRLSFLPREVIEDHLAFYTELINDRMEEGLSEEEAVASAGSTEDIAAQIMAEYPALPAAADAAKPEARRKWWVILLLVLGSPIWLSLGIAAAAVALSLYASLWAMIISLWAVWLSVAVSAAAFGVYGIILAFSGGAALWQAALGAGLLCAGLAILTYFGCLWLTKGTVRLTKKAVIKAAKPADRRGMA